MRKSLDPQKNFGVVTWRDAHGRSEEVAEKDIKHEPEIYRTYGWIIRSDEGGVSLAPEWNINSNTWRDVTFVDRPMVVSEQILSLSKKREKKIAV